jgi:hypothetical protein
MEKDFMLRCSLLMLTGLILAAGTTGCEKGPPPGPPLATPYRVQGRIKLPNGSLLCGGVIYFTPTQVKAGSKVRYEGAGPVDAQGNYVIGFGGDEAGVPTGEYKVTIKPRDYQELRHSNSAWIPAKYREQSTTPLTVTVKEEDNTFDFELN